MSSENNQNKILNSALFYWDLGFMPIPMQVFFEKADDIRAEKKPLCKWADFQTTRASKEELAKLFNNPNSQMAILTGKQAGILVIDQDIGASEENIALLNSFPTLIVQTPSGGKHHYYKYPNIETKIKSRSAIFGENSHIDVRAEGGLAMVPPSEYPNGTTYTCETKFSREKIADLPLELLEKIIDAEKNKEKLVEKKWLNSANGTIKGSRNETATSMAGKILSTCTSELWDTIGWEQLEIWNSKNNPPLEISELKNVWESVKKYHTQEQKKGPSDNQADRIVHLIQGNPDVTLFKSELDEPFICFPVDGHKEYWSLKDKKTKWWIAKEFWNKYQKSPSGETINTALNTLQGFATFGAEKYILANRVALKDGNIFYSLSNDNWEAIKISPTGWTVEKDVPILFRRHTHQTPQVYPKVDGDVRDIFKYINVKNEDHQILFLVWLIACFIPDFPHPILYLYGPQGSAKTTSSRLVKKVNDPSKIETFEIPKDQKELVQKLSHHWCLMFDNISYISQDLSDILCRAVTGSGFSKRELYSDDSDIIYTFKRCMSINGINLLALKPDLLERSILVELDRVSKTNRKNEQDLMKEFDENLPTFLGAIMDVVSKALSLRSSVTLKETPRMADFALWGYVIAEALGYGGDKFIECYFDNINLQNEEVINESPVASSIVSLMERQSYWEDSATKLLELISFDAGENKKDIPKTPQALSRLLNVLKTNLEECGITVEKTGGRKRKIIIRKKGENVASTASLLPEVDINKSKDF